MAPGRSSVCQGCGPRDGTRRESRRRDAAGWCRGYGRNRRVDHHEFIEKLPGAYDFVISERGSNLSMGQRQLISFVRALVFNPDILILDEATSSIDPETESVIQYAIEKLIEKRTSIIIAHRLSTIRHADQVMVMDHGEVKEIGSHEALLEDPHGLYRKLYEYQFSRYVESE